MITSRYYSYLIRIWQDDDLPKREWLASLEDPTTQQLTYFKSLEDLFAFLQKQSGLSAGKTLPFDHVREGHNNSLVK